MIRSVVLSDADAITSIYNKYIIDTTVSFEVNALSVEEMRERIKAISSHYPYFVYEKDGQVIGYCYAHCWKERAAYSHTYETTIYLTHEGCRQGIGSQLMQRLIESCRLQGCHALIACITGENEASMQFHRHLGFTQVSLFKEVGMKFGRKLDVVDMELLL